MTRFWNSLALGALLFLLAACGAGRLGQPAGQPVPDPEGFAEGIRRQLVPQRPEQYTFAWTLDEQGSQVRGRGAVRTEAAERIRLDLFGPRGETYLIAALVGDEYRLPPEATNVATLPSQSLLWAALGVLNPPREARLVSATRSASGAELRYDAPDGHTFVYTLLADADTFRLQRLERAARRGVAETVWIDRGADGAIARARYRNWGELRDLTLDVETIRAQEPFPPSIWRPDAV